jgi:hypothetical protein
MHYMTCSGPMIGHIRTAGDKTMPCWAVRSLLMSVLVLAVLALDIFEILPMILFAWSSLMVTVV